MIVSAIVAVSQNGVIGKDNDLPWHLPTDMKYFKRTTLGHHVIMGRKNFLAMGRPLPGRTNVVITRNPTFTANGCLVVHSVEEALQRAERNGEKEVFVIGGGEIYAASMALWDRLYLTRVEAEIEGDVFFPEWEESDWHKVHEEAFPADEQNEYPFTILRYERRRTNA
jgi:dihydrofolate reductase